MHRIFSTTALMTLTLLSSPAMAMDSGAVESKLEMMMQRLERLETENKQLRKQVAGLSKATSHAVPKEVSALREADALTLARQQPASGGGMTIPGTDTTVKIGGYVKADAIMDVNSGYGADFAKFAAIPLDGSVDDNKSSDFHMHARQTRVNLKTVTPTAMGDLKTVVEGDFYGSRGSELVTNGHSPQLRLAYGEIGGLLAGQNWSNFMDLKAYPESLDFIGPVGITLLRQVQVRYSNQLEDGWGYSVSLENPNADFTNAGTDTVVDGDRLPDVVLGLNKDTSWGHWAARGLLRDIAVENETTGQSENEFGYALSLTSRINVGEKDNLKLRASYGDGVGRYIYDIATSSKAAAYNNNELQTQSAFAGYASYQHHWSDEFRSNFMGGYAKIDNETGRIGSANNETIWSGHANFIWQPVMQYKMGLEYIHGYRELDNGTDGALDRVQASFIYSIN